MYAYILYKHVYTYTVLYIHTYMYRTYTCIHYTLYFIYIHVHPFIRADKVEAESEGGREE